MKFPLLRTVYRTPLLRLVGRRLSPTAVFRLSCLWSRFLWWCYPHSARSLAPVVALFRSREGIKAGRARALDHLTFRRWVNHLEHAWCVWAGKADQLCVIMGEELLAAALKAGEGAILLSAQEYGHVRMVAPVLAQRGYCITRWGSPVGDCHQEARWGKGDYARWNHLNYRGDRWHQFRMIQSLRSELAQNRVVHMSIQLLKQADCEYRVANCYRELYLDPRTIALLELLGVPVLPTFALMDRSGKVVLKIYQPIPPTSKTIIRGFGEIYAAHLDQFPELARNWRRILRSHSTPPRGRIATVPLGSVKEEGDTIPSECGVLSDC